MKETGTFGTDIPAIRMSAGLLRSQSLPVTRDGAALWIDLGDRRLSGAWVTIRFRDLGSAGVGRVLLDAVAAGSDAPVIHNLPEEALGNDVFGWTGRLPEQLVGIRLAPLSRIQPVAISEVVIGRRSRPSLVSQAFLRQPSLTARAVYWRCFGLKVRARGFLARALGHRGETGYRDWIRQFDAPSAAEKSRIRAEVEGWNAPPLISVVMPVYNPAPKVLAAALRSVQSQIYPHWELCIADDASTDPAIPRLLSREAARDPRIRLTRRAENGHIARATNDAVAMATGTHVAFLDHDDVLAETALYHIAAALHSDRALDLIYSDEDKIDVRGRRFDPHFKSDYNRELLYSQNYINHLTVVRRSLVRDLGGLRPGFEGSQDHDLLLRLSRELEPAKVRHIPKVLYHWRAASGSGTFSDRALAQAEAARLQSLSEVVGPAGARAERGLFGFNRLVRPIPDPAPLVSIVIPIRDRAELLAIVLDGLFEKTAYEPIEVVVVDNDSREPATSSLFAAYRNEPRFRVVSVVGAFNFSDLSNRGAQAAKGSVLLFLNNDVEVVDSGWLRELVSIAIEPEVGAVGAKLLYPDGTLQHGGIVLGIGGVAGHSHLGLAGDEPGYFARMAVAQEVSGVTGACLAMRADVFKKVGGFDAVDLAVAFNDVDLCLRVRRAGYRIIWTPYARLIHHESKSRGPEDTPEKRARFEAETRVMRERWEPELRADPFYNPNLSRRSAHFRL